MEKCFQCGQLKKEGKRIPYYERERPPASVFICSDCVLGPTNTFIVHCKNKYREEEFEIPAQTHNEAIIKARNFYPLDDMKSENIDVIDKGELQHIIDTDEARWN